jgi:dolichol kinase
VKPEMPYLAAGAISIAGGAMAEKKWPKNATRSLIGTVVLVIVASATSETAIAPLVKAFGTLVLLIAVLAAGKYISDSRKVKK